MATLAGAVILQTALDGSIRTTQVLWDQSVAKGSVVIKIHYHIHRHYTQGQVGLNPTCAETAV